MANCPNCGAPLLPGARFCDQCGAPAPAEAARTPAEAEIAEVPAPEAAEAPASAEKKRFVPKRWMLYAAIGVVAAALLIAAISLLSARGGGGGGLYLKDGELYYTGRDGARELTADLAGALDPDAAALPDFGARLGGAAALGGDGKALFYPDRLTGAGFALYYRRLDRSGEALRLDSDVTRYAVNDAASLVTYLKNGNLYRYDLKKGEKEKLDGGVADFRVSADGKRAVYIDADAALYLLEAGRDRQELDGEADRIEAVSDDCKTVLYLRDGALCLYVYGREREKIASNVAYVAAAYGSGDAYYVKSDGESAALYYFDREQGGSALLTDALRGVYAAAEGSPALAFSDTDSGVWAAGGAAMLRLDAGAPAGFAFGADGRALCYVDGGGLYRVSVSNGAAAEPELVDTGVHAHAVRLAAGLGAVYFKDVSNGAGALYAEGTLVDEDVRLDAVERAADGALLYFTDWSAAREYGTLRRWANGAAATVADDVHAAASAAGGGVLYLRDYSPNRRRGDLYLYAGGRSERLDDDVGALVPAGTVGAGAYFGLDG